MTAGCISRTHGHNDFHLQYLTDVPELQQGDTVTLYGSASLTMDEAASWLGTINYELPCMLNARVPRVYKG